MVAASGGPCTTGDEFTSDHLRGQGGHSSERNNETNEEEIATGYLGEGGAYLRG